MTFTESDHPRATTGTFATKDQSDPEVGLPATLPRITVPLTGSIDLDPGYWEELPEWPAAVDAPEVSYDFNDGRVETNLWVDGKVITFWEGSDGDSYNTLRDDWTTASSETEWDEGTQEAIVEWGSAVHSRIDSATYSAMLEGSTGSMAAAITAYATGEPYKAPVVKTEDRDNTALEAGDILVGLDGTELTVISSFHDGDRVSVETSFGLIYLAPDGVQAVKVH